MHWSYAALPSPYMGNDHTAVHAEEVIINYYLYALSRFVCRPLALSVIVSHSAWKNITSIT